ncbi:MAG TPA: 50S ribosomal protein L25 [Acidimicrobiales bacterium]|nr:50S ribosomal protein L25 [Acidimicrobiales bacterium]
MAELTLVAETGRATGSRPARRLRAEGRIPAVVYGNGVDPVAVSVAARDLRSVLSTEAGVNAVLSLEVGETTLMTMARALQRHPVRNTVIHVDFQVVDPNREITSEVPITLVGEAVELHRADGILDQQLFALPIRSRPSDIPPNLEVDISELVIGSAVRVSDIVLPPGVATDLDPESVVAAGQAPRVEVAPEAAEGEEAAEAAAAATEAAGEGEAPTEATGSGEG